MQRDLHDGIGPSLAGLTMKVGAARFGLEAGDRQAAATALADIERQLGDCVTDVRQLLLGLHSPRLDRLGLVGALQQQASQSRRERFRMKSEGGEPEMRSISSLIIAIV